ncbi:MAG TPA: FG-GAP-like repeat-containing protein [Gemmatimonadaceae bacterium]
MSPWTATLLALVSSTSLLVAQPPATPPEITTAQAALQAGQVDSAIRTLEGYFSRNPNATAGWLLLGNAYRQKGDLPRALASFQKVTVPRLARLQASYNIAGILATTGNADSAITLLQGLKASGAFDMSLATTAPEFAPLRSHPRFPSTQFMAEDFQNPFVEKVRIIHEWVGETKGDQFSWIARSMGDVDGDRVSDIVTSAPTYGASGQPAGRGRVYVYSGRSGKLVWQFTGDSGESVGIGLEGAGDTNRDGIPDVVAGAPGSARAYVLSGKDGTVLHRLQGNPGEGFGTSSAGAGDQDGDGFADVVIGAPGSNAAGQGAGSAYVHSGRTGSLIVRLDGEQAGDAFGSIVAGDRDGQGTPVLVGAPRAGPGRRGRVYTFGNLRAPATFVLESDSTGTALGAMFTSLVGDVDGDRVTDVFASDFSNAARGPATGRVYVRSGRTGAPLLTLTGEHPGDGFGIGSANVGDVNGDGHDDLVVGAWQYSVAAPSGGKIYVYSGRDGTLLRSITGRVPGETLGFDATGAGDVDGDGTNDFLVTSSWSNIRGFRSGRMYVISGKPG